MIKILLVVFGLAAYGAYALVERVAPVNTPQAAVSPGAPDAPLLSVVASNVGNWALVSTAEAAGLLVLPTGPDICDASSLVSLENLEQFNQLLPPAAQVLLGELQVAADKTPVQRYTGADGIGVCFTGLGQAAVWPLSGVN